MLDKKLLSEVVNEAISGSDIFVVDITVSADNVVDVELDSMGSIDIDTCVALSREIEKRFDRDVEDYELQVGSAGLTSPFKVKQQYDKNIGNQVEVLTKDGQKLKGTLKSADDTEFTITVQKKVKPEGAKRPVMVDTDMTFNYSEIKYTKYLIEFK
ncbi:MAG: ribosome assembly cofactor RimP, partial [Muribaculaceae bacterium]